MIHHSLVKELRESGQKDLTRLKQEIEARKGDLTPLTTSLFQAIFDGSLSSDYFRTYFDCAKDFGILAAGLRQTQSFYIRSQAIRQISLAVHDDTFTEVWDALGGARGIASLARDLAVCHVHDLCRALGLARHQRRQHALSELLNLLCPLDDVSAPESDARDPRPLQPAYMRLVRGCTPELTKKWYDARAGKWGKREIQCFLTAHGDEWRQQELDELLMLPDDKVLRVGWLECYMERDRKFTKHVLKSLVECPKALKVDSQNVASKVILPLAKFIQRSGSRHRRSTREFRHETWTLIHAALTRWPEMATRLNDFSPYSMAWFAVEWWTYADIDGNVARKASIWTIASGILECLLKERVGTLHMSDIRNFLRAARFQDRFHLLKHILRHQKQHGFDLTYPSSTQNLAAVTKLKLLNAPIPCELFTMIPAQGALDFLDLLEEARHTEVRIACGKGVLSTASVPSGAWIDLLVLRCHLLQRDPEILGDRRLSILPEVEKELKRRMETAAKSREATDRQFWVLSALSLCVASGSVDLYSDTLQWARRYKRDYSVNQAIQNQYLQPTVQASNILSGTHVNTPFDAVKNCIDKGNKIALSIFEITSEFREPTTPPPSHLWNCTSMATALAKTRVCQIDEFQTRHSLSDDQVYDIVWQPTFSMLVEAERLFLGSIREELRDISVPNGLLDLAVRSDEKNEKVIFKNHVWRFLDQLSRARDQLWMQERIKRHPAVITLQGPWCKGLPIQFLLPKFLLENAKDYHRYNQDRQGGETSRLPYLLTKAKEIVFTDPKLLLQPPPQADDGDSARAIQDLVDDYALAVEFVVHGQGGDKEKTSTDIWQHLFPHLVDCGLSDGEAVQFLRRWVFGPTFTHLPIQHVVVKPPSKQVNVGLPQWVPDDGPLAWDPSPVEQVASTLDDPTKRNDPPITEKVEKDLSRLSFWHMLAVNGYYKCKKNDNPLRPKLRTKLRTFRTSPYKVLTTEFHVPLQKVTTPPETVDSKIVKEMLMFNDQHGADSSFLMQPFPSPKNFRFPAVYLADEFLESKHDKRVSWPSNMEDNIQHVPVDLLLQLCSSVFKKMTSQKADSHITWAYMNLIKLLGRSDRPAAACNVYRDIILTRPEDSSWHRDLLHEGFLKRLSRTEAKTFLLDMARSIVDRLQAQAKYKFEEGKPAADAPVIKVTIVKMLAQIMRGAQFIDMETACEVLGSILNNARHIDMRAAAVSVLADYFTNAPKGSDTTAIIKVLETVAVPVAACLSERYPMTEERWAEAEKTGEMPEIDSFDNTSRPIMAHLAAISDVQLSQPEWKGKWHETLVAKAIERSKNIHSRWMSLFLKINSLSLAEGELMPELPVNMLYFHDCIAKQGDNISLDTFNRVKQVALEFLHNPPKSITAAVQNSKDLSKSKAGEHWLFVWSDAGTTTPGNLVMALAYKLSCPGFPLTRSANLTSVEDIQEFLLSLADTFINTANLDEVDFLVHSFTSIYRDIQSVTTWKANSVPIVNDIISKIESIRASEAWKKNKKRIPARLSDTLELRLDLVMALYERIPLTIPELAVEIKDLLGMVVSTYTPYYHPKWEKLKRQVNNNVGLREKQLKLAWELVKNLDFAVSSELSEPTSTTQESVGGRGSPSLEEYLKVEFGLELMATDFQDWDGPFEAELNKEVMDDLRGWLKKVREGCEDEVIREGAREALRLGYVGDDDEDKE
ncbi:hypothetical protein QBC38DRAFT_503598 [Podospora fimiseda]|uniref:Uncharacterized protein n=1 Tax=Podospora fimiseda TaxID=252190 RepID=A0AAN6YRS5_9PEZI|nr:hypothetical protein QBC38DRAFT_503598 [Podospora fimiseda]